MSSSNPPSNLVLCIDGTGNDQINGPEFKDTNVAKISHLIKNWHQSTDGEKRVQSVLYQQGVGTTSSLGDGQLAKMQKVFDQLFATREGIAKMVAVNYAYISANYRKQDKLFLFGFSRGAYVARLTASLVADVGAFKFSEMDKPDPKVAQMDLHECVATIVRAWISSAGDKSQLAKGLAPFGTTCFIPAYVDFLGVYDTVASINTPDLHGTDLQSKRFKFAEEVAHRPNIRRAYHAVAISEHRGNFKPVLWKDWPVMPSRGTPQQTISQVWFPGYHTSSAGGSKQPGVTISAVGLVWMVSKCQDILGIDEEKLQGYLHKTVTQVPAEAINDSCKGVYANAGDYFRSCMGSGAGESKHVVCEVGKWATWTGIAAMPNMKGGMKPGEVIDGGGLGFDELNDFEGRYLGMIEKWRGGMGDSALLAGGCDKESNPASFLGASARVDAPRGQVATNMAEVTLGKGRRGQTGDDGAVGHGHEGVTGDEKDAVDSSGGSDDIGKPKKKKSLWRSVKRRFSLRGKGGVN